MSREVHVQFWERVGVKLPGATHLVILCRSRAEQAREQMEKLMGRLKLKVNAQKTRIARVPQESFDFLGYTMGRCYRLNGSQYIGTQPSKKRIAAFCKDISALTDRNSYWMPVETKVAELNLRLRGWGNYFCLGPVSRAYAVVDNHARHRLRQWLNGKHSSRGKCTRRYAAAYLHCDVGLLSLARTTRNFSWAKA